MGPRSTRDSRCIPTRFVAGLVVAAALVASPSAATAQDTAEPVATGTAAPDFALVGASAEGVLPDSIRPTDFRGHTLVIAFFFRARSSG